MLNGFFIRNISYGSDASPHLARYVTSSVVFVRSEFLGKNVLLVDDSIVRGTTSMELVQMAREAGAVNVSTFPGGHKAHPAFLLQGSRSSGMKQTFEEIAYTTLRTCREQDTKMTTSLTLSRVSHSHERSVMLHSWSFLLS